MTFEVREGDCVELMRAMPAASVDAVVCDPPAGIGFMSKAWDHHRGGMNPWVEWMADVLREALRVCKPGVHAFVWSLPRTSHWTGSALELAGWEVRDVCTHLFGSGFPKSHNLPNGFGTALKPAAEFWWLARKPLCGTVAATVLEHGTGALNVDGCRVDTREQPQVMGAKLTSTTYGDIDVPGGKVYDMGRWPANVVLSHMEECVPVGTRKVKSSDARKADGTKSAAMGETWREGSGLRPELSKSPPTYNNPDGTETVTAYRCHPDCPVRLLDEQTGELHSQDPRTRQHPGAGKFENQGAGDDWRTERGAEGWYGDQGGASRFFATFSNDHEENECSESENVPVTPGASVVSGAGKSMEGTAGGAAGRSGGRDETRFRYVAKASRGERNAGLEGFETANQHPTVKPISLMRWLVRLVTPPPRPCEACDGSGGFGGGTGVEPEAPLECSACDGSGVRRGVVLDPFCGSGSTGCAAVLEGFDFIGLEREEEYVRIAEARIGWWHKHRGDGEVAEILAAGELRDEVEATGQASLFDDEPVVVDRANREGEASADRTYTDRGGSNFAMKPGRRRVS